MQALHNYVPFFYKGFKRRVSEIGLLQFTKEIMNYYQKYLDLANNISNDIPLSYKFHLFYTYFKVSFFIPTMNRNEIMDFIPRQLQKYYLPIVNPNKEPMVNKIKFYQILKENNIKIPNTYCYKVNDIVYNLSGEILRDFSFPIAFAKSISGSGGEGAYVAKYLNSKTIRSGFLYQEILKSHCELNKIAESKALNTIRIHSFLTKNGEIEIQSAHLKLAIAGITDNIGGGGIGVEIDIQTGRLMKIGFAEVGEQRWFKKHPLGNNRFENFLIPYWEDVLTLLKALHDIFPEIRSVGWDIAITNDGPYVIEGNAGGDIFIPQLFIKRFYNTKMIEEVFLSQDGQL